MKIERFVEILTKTQTSRFFSSILDNIESIKFDIKHRYVRGMLESLNTIITRIDSMSQALDKGVGEGILTKKEYDEIVDGLLAIYRELFDIVCSFLQKEIDKVKK